MSRGGFRALLTAVEAGFQPLGTAIGAVAFQAVQPWGCGSLNLGTGPDPVVYDQYEEGLRTAWRTAIERLDADAVRLGAHGVVGVTVKRELTTSGLHLQVSGSAVVVPGVAPLARPFLSTISWQDTLKVLLGGWVPSGVCVGVSAVHVHAWSMNTWRLERPLSNEELSEATAGVLQARSRAQYSATRPLVGCGERMVAATVELVREPSSCRGDKATGVLVEGLILGTAVTRYRDPVIRPSGARDLTGAARG